MMPSQILDIFRRNRNWLNALILVFSVLIWLDVSSNRDSILHAVGKLGFAIRGYGTVNVILLVVALVWSFGGFLVVTATFKVGITTKPLLYFLFVISSIVATTSLVGVIFDNWFSAHVLVAVICELMELFLAGWTSWTIFFRPSDRIQSYDLLGGGLFGLLGLIFVTSIALLACPRVTYRF